MAKSEVKIGAILSYITILLNTLIGIFYTPFLTHMLGQSEYGLYSLVASVISYITILDFGFGNAITVYTSKYIAKNDSIGMKKLNGMFLIVYTSIGIIAAMVGVFIIFNIERLFSQTMTIDEIETAKILMTILTFNVAITFPFSLFSNIITAYEKFIFSKTLNIIRIAALPLCMTPLLLTGFKSISLAILTTLINVVVILANTWYCYKKIHIKFSFKHFDKILFLEIISYSFFIFLNQIVDKINWGLNNFILGAICGTTAVAVYSVALQFNNMYLSFSTAISSVMLPKVSKMEANKASDEDFTEIFIKTGRVQYFIMGLIITGFIIFGKQFIILLFGNEYVDAYIIACILMIPVTVPLIQNVGLSIMQAKNKFQFRAVMSIVVALLSIILSVILAKPYGGIGASIGTGASFLIFNFIIMNIYYWKVININIFQFWKEIIKISIPIVILFSLSLIIISWINYNGIIWFIFEILLYACLYVVLIWVFSLNDYEKQLLIKPINSLIYTIKTLI